MINKLSPSSPSSPGAHATHTSPPPSPAGNLPPAQPISQPTCPLPPFSTPCQPQKTQLLPQVEDALDLDYCSSPEVVESSAATLKTGESLERKESRDKGTEVITAGIQLRSVVVKPAAHRVSYKDALVGATAFKANSRTTRDKTTERRWSEVSYKQRRDRTPVWSRLGPGEEGIHGMSGGKEHLGPRPPPGTSFLQLLKSKTEGRCFNCFARDHRIAQCRDPPKRILCSRSGHKARHCKAPPRKVPPRSEAPTTRSAGSRVLKAPVPT